GTHSAHLLSRRAITRLERSPRSNEAERNALAAHFRFLELGGGNRPVESLTQLSGRFQGELNTRPRARIEGRVDEVERDDVAQRGMACMVVSNHRLRQREPLVPALSHAFSAEGLDDGRAHALPPISPDACRRK